MDPGQRVVGILSALLAVALTAGPAAGHAFPDRADPRVGAVVRGVPGEVRIWFDGDLEPAFSTVTVTAEDGRTVDRGDAGVDPQDRRLLRVGLRPLQPGQYRVSWRVLSVDGHRTSGDYRFTVRAPE